MPSFWVRRLPCMLKIYLISFNLLFFKSYNIASIPKAKYVVYCSNIVILCTYVLPMSYIVVFVMNFLADDILTRINHQMHSNLWEKKIPGMEKNSWSIEQFIRTVVGQNNLETECFFNLFLEAPLIWYICMLRDVGRSENLGPLAPPHFRHFCCTYNNMYNSNSKKIIWI